MRSVKAGLLVVLVLAVACTDTDPAIRTATFPAAGTGGGAETPAAAVQGLFDALAADEYARAASGSVPSQEILVALVEGMTVSEAARLLEAGAAHRVGANFWEGFGIGLEDFLGYGAGQWTVGEVEEFAVSGVSFAAVEVTVPAEGRERRLIVREQGGRWWVDPLASFAPALAPRLVEVAETARTHVAGKPVLELLRAHEVSLEASLHQPDVTPELRQAVISVIAALRR